MIKLLNIINELDINKTSLFNFVKRNKEEIINQTIGEDEYPEDMRYEEIFNYGERVWIGEGGDSICLIDHEPTEQDIEDADLADWSEINIKGKKLFYYIPEGTNL